MRPGRRALAAAARIDRCSAAAGAVAAWLVLAMVLLGAYNAVARYLGRYLALKLSSNAYIELQWYLFSLVFLLAAAHTLRHDGHVRVDVLYSRLAPRARAWVDLVGSLALLLPFCVFAIVVSWPAVRSSWAVREASPDPGGLPRYPLKTAILVAFGLLFLQGVAGAIRRVVELAGAGAAPAGERSGDRP